MSIQIQKLVKKFNHFTAVNEVSFTVSDGEFISLLGPSGSGKSTVLRCIAGLEMPTDGSILINDEDVTRIPVQERKVGFVFQHYALFKNMNLLENVAFGLQVRRIKKSIREAKASSLLELVGLKGLEKRMPSQISGGQRQRVALARALAPEPSLLLLDEPFGALDTRLRKELRSWLKELHQRIHLTSVLVTHDQEEAFELSDRILVMNRGVVEQEAPPQQIFDAPATQFVAQFVGETNQVEGVVDEGTVAWGPFNFKSVHLPQGSKARVLFRPNDVYVVSRREDGGWPGVILSIQFLGSIESLEIEMQKDCIVTAVVPKGVAEQSNFQVGKQVYVAVTMSHVFALK